MATTEAIFEELGFDLKAVRQPEGAIIYAIARTYGLIVRKLAEIYRRFGLSPAAFNLLLLLSRGQDPGSFTQRELGKRLVVSASDMSGLVDRMEARGLVRRGPGKDRRSHLLRITPKGEALVEQVWPHHAEAIAEMTARVSAADRAAVSRTLRTLRQAMGV